MKIVTIIEDNRITGVTYGVVEIKDATLDTYNYTKKHQEIQNRKIRSVAKNNTKHK